MISLDNKKLNDVENMVFSAIKSLYELIPSEYDEYDIPFLTVFKTLHYNGGIAPVYSRYHKLNNLFHTFCCNDLVAHKISMAILKRRLRHHNESFGDENKKREFVLDLQQSDNKISFNNKNNLFVASMPSYLKVIVSYIKKAKRNNNLIVIPRFLKNHEVLDDIKNNIIIFDDYVDSNKVEEYAKIKKSFLNIFLKSEEKFYRAFSIRKDSLYPLFRNGIKNIFSNIIPNAILYCDTAKRILSDLNVKSVVCVRLKRTYENAFILSALHLNIYKYMMIHGTVHTGYGNILKFGHFSNLDGIFVWGQEQKDIINKYYDATNSKIFITGTPLIDSLEPDTSVVERREKNILFAVDGNDVSQLKIIKKAIKKCGIMVNLIVKVHPGCDHKIYIKHCNCSNIHLKTGDEVLENYFGKADIFITKYSTAALQAMAMEIPTLFAIINRKNKKKLPTLYNFDIVERKIIVADKKRSIIRKISDLLTSEDYVFEHKKTQNKYLKRVLAFSSYPEMSVDTISSIIDMSSALGG